MADNNKFPRRSSILKTASDENTTSGPSKPAAMLTRRVSFHGTRTVKEYFKDDHLVQMTPHEEPMQLTMSSDGRAELSYSATVMAGAGLQNIELTNTVTFGMTGPQVSSTPLTSRRRSSSCPRFIDEDTGAAFQPRPALFPL
ncbi:hypothetical protein AAVH_06567 [Aphelenchoides avenae]|nr:hypothetical protein AAVH_06567 [Aphelenchus avenae]